jgi:hypothetical protein
MPHADSITHKRSLGIAFTPLDNHRGAKVVRRKEYGPDFRLVVNHLSVDGHAGRLLDVDVDRVLQPVCLEMRRAPMTKSLWTARVLRPEANVPKHHSTLSYNIMIWRNLP